MSFKYQQQAFNNEPFPAGMTSQEFFVYIPLRALYQQFKAGQITKEQAQKEKEELELYAIEATWEHKVSAILEKYIPKLKNADETKQMELWSEIVDTTNQFGEGESKVYQKMIELLEVIAEIENKA